MCLSKQPGLKTNPNNDSEDIKVSRERQVKIHRTFLSPQFSLQRQKNMINYVEKFKSIETGPKITLVITAILKEALELCTVYLWLDENMSILKVLI